MFLCARACVCVCLLVVGVPLLPSVSCGRPRLSSIIIQDTSPAESMQSMVKIANIAKCIEFLSQLFRNRNFMWFTCLSFVQT